MHGYWRMSNPKRRYRRDGQKSSEEYRANGVWHREDGPAFTHWYENGQVRCEAYVINDKAHRADGPAYIEWDESGNMCVEEFWLHDKEVTALDVFGDTPDYMFWALKQRLDKPR